MVCRSSVQALDCGCDMTCSSSSLVILNYVENDTLPEIQCEYKDRFGEPIDIEGYTFNLHIGYNPTPLDITGAIVGDHEEGIFKFTFVPGDIRQGKFLGEIQITDDNGDDLTYQGFQFNIKPEIL